MDASIRDCRIGFQYPCVLLRRGKDLLYTAYNAPLNDALASPIDTRRCKRETHHVTRFHESSSEITPEAPCRLSGSFPQGLTAKYAIDRPPQMGTEGRG